MSHNVSRNHNLDSNIFTVLCIRQRNKHTENDKYWLFFTGRIISYLLNKYKQEIFLIKLPLCCDEIAEWEKIDLGDTWTRPLIHSATEFVAKSRLLSQIQVKKVSVNLYWRGKWGKLNKIHTDIWESPFVTSKRVKLSLVQSDVWPVSYWSGWVELGSGKKLRGWGVGEGNKIILFRLWEQRHAMN